MGEHGFGPGAFPTIVAHRGASSTRPENTVSAFEEAVRMGAGLVELDVRLSRDGVPVVMHDATVDRTTDGRGRVDELDAGAIASLNAGTADAPEPIPTLERALGVLSGRSGVVVEIKNLPWEPGYRSDATPFVEAIVGALERVRFQGTALVVSFDARTVTAWKGAVPNVPVGLLSAPPVDPRDALTFAAERGLEMLLPGTRSLLPAGDAFVEEVHRAGLWLGTWTVDDADLLRTLFDAGVDAVASNDPEMALAVLAERTSP